MKKILFILLALSSVTLAAQAPRFRSTELFLSPSQQKIILTDYEGIAGDLSPLKTTLYYFPLDCDSAISLKPGFHVRWSVRDTYIALDPAGEPASLLLYDNRGNERKTFHGTMGFTFIHYDNTLFFFRERTRDNKHYPQIWRYDIEKNLEELVYEFDAVWSLISPDCVDICRPRELDYFGGGYHGIIYQGEYPDFKTFTYVISRDGKLKFLKEGVFLPGNDPLPEDGYLY